MNRFTVARCFLGLLAACAAAALLLFPAAASEAVFPLASRLGMVPPAGMMASTSFAGFEDAQNNVFVRLVTLPGAAFGQLNKTMTNDALKKQGMTVEKRETMTLPSGKAILLIARQEAGTERIRKWILIAPIANVTALVSFEMPAQGPARYPDKAIRSALTSITARASVPVDEQLAVLPFKLTELAGLRLVGVAPGVGAQFTDGEKDGLEAADQAHLVIAAVAGGPRHASDRDNFARLAFTGLPSLLDVRIVNSESMRIGGQPGHELRAVAKQPQTGADIEIVQWLRFGTSAHLRILGLAPRENWTAAFTRFRTVRDGLEPR